MENLMYLKSGTDIRGTALSKDGGNIDLTDSRIESIIFSFVHFLKQKLKKDGLSISVVRFAPYFKAYFRGCRKSSAFFGRFNIRLRAFFNAVYVYVDNKFRA